MHLVCLDLEGVLVPEIWLAVAEYTGVTDLRLTTRDISDYDVLMKTRISLLRSTGITVHQIRNIIEQLEPLDGAKSFLDSLRRITQVVILSDTFRQFASPFLAKLDWPTLFCNDLIIDNSGTITDYRMRQHDGKRNAVRAFKSMGLHVIAAGDSYNDLAMIREANVGALFRPPSKIAAESPDLACFDEYDPFLAFLKRTADR